MKIIIALILLTFVVSCSVFQKEEEYLSDWSLFSQLEISKDTFESVEKKFGSPDKIITEDMNEYIGPKEVQWNYNRKGVSKILTYFKEGMLESASMDVWEGEDVLVLAHLLDRFPGKWKVEKEPVTISHAMPSKCYLVDEPQGKEIEIDGYKKTVESISKRNPKISQEEWRGAKKLKTYSGWEHDHCAWLKDFLKSKNLFSDGEK